MIQHKSFLILGIAAMLSLYSCKPNKKQLLGAWKLEKIELVDSSNNNSDAAAMGLANLELQLADKYFFFDIHNRYGIVNDFGDTLELTTYTSTAKKLVLAALENTYVVKGDTLWIQEEGNGARLKLYRLPDEKIKTKSH